MAQLKNCRICDSSDLTEIMDFGNQPWCNDFLKANQVGKESFYPLVLIFCNNCSVSQLNYTVKKEVMFGDHTYLSGITRTLSDHFLEIRTDIIDKFEIKEKKKILDIGSNDGTFLNHFKDIGWHTLGIEPSKTTYEIAKQKNINTVNKFFNLDLAYEINEKFSFINASGVFFHLEELHSFTKGVEFLLDKKGVFIIQFLYMDSIIKNTAFDQIYHEHLLYYNLKTLNNLLSMHNLEIFDAKLYEIHGGQMTVFVSRKNERAISKNFLNLLKIEEEKGSNKIDNYFSFKKNIQKLKETNLKFVENAIKNNKKIFGYGAPVKGNSLLNYFGFTTKHIPKLLEVNTTRKGLYAPGSHIPVEMENEQNELPDIFYVLAWNFKKEILKKNRDLIKKGIEFYFPVNIQ